MGIQMDTQGKYERDFSFDDVFYNSFPDSRRITPLLFYFYDSFISRLPPTSRLATPCQFVDMGADSLVLFQEKNENLLKIYGQLQDSIRRTEFEKSGRDDTTSVNDLVESTLSLYFTMSRRLRKKIFGLQEKEPISSFLGSSDVFSLEISSPGMLMRREDAFASVIRRPIVGKNFLQIKEEDSKKNSFLEDRERKAYQVFLENRASISCLLREKILEMNLGEDICRTSFSIGEMNAKPLFDLEGNLIIAITDIANVIRYIIPA